MGKAEIIKDSVKGILSMMVMVLIFVIGILVLCFSSLLVGHQEELKTAEGEIIYVDQASSHGSSGKGTTIVVENDDDLKVKVIKPISPNESVIGQ